MAGRAPPLLAAVCLSIVGCGNGTNAVIDVRSNRDVVFSIPEADRGDYCISAAEIRYYPQGRRSLNYQTKWLIRLRQNTPGPCDHSLNYPRAPRDFVTEVSSEYLPPGEYFVLIYGGVGTATGGFSIPSG
jgi:hypothetical protein